MKFVRYLHTRSDAQTEPRWGVLDGNDVYAVAGDLFASSNMQPGQQVGRSNALTLLTRAAPTKLLAVGRNYQKHIDEMAARMGPNSNLTPRPEHPTFFLKPLSAIIGPKANIVYPTGQTQHVEHEAELGLVIGRRC